MNPDDPNLRLDIFDGETAREFIKSKQDEKLKLIESSNQDGEPEPGKRMGSDLASAPTMGSEKESTPTTGSSNNDNTEDPTFQKVTPENLKPKDLVGRTILLNHDDGTKLRAKILKFVNNSKDDDIKNSQALKFHISMVKISMKNSSHTSRSLTTSTRIWKTPENGTSAKYWHIKDPSPRNTQITRARHTTSR
jgi:hypothetical protein